MSDYGFNFRASVGPPPSDAANTTYVNGDTYPTVRNGITFGWGSAVLTFDSGGAEARLYGINYAATGSATFQVDLPAAGTYTFQLAMGFQGAPLTSQKLIVKDNTTTLLTIGPSTATNFLDATGTSYSAANWPASETSVSLTFATTTAFFVIGPPTTDNVAIAHIFLSSVTSTSIIEFDSKSDGGSVTGTSLTWNHTIVSAINSLLLVYFDVVSTTDDLTSVTCGGVAMNPTITAYDEFSGSGTHIWHYVYHLAGVTAGVKAMAINISSSSVITADAAAFINTRQTGIPDASAHGHGTTSSTVNVTSVAASCWLFAGSRILLHAVGDGGTYSGGVTLRQRNATLNTVQIGDSAGEVTPGIHAITLTGASGDGVELIVLSFAPFVARRVGPFPMFRPDLA